LRAEGRRRAGVLDLRVDGGDNSGEGRVSVVVVVTEGVPMVVGMVKCFGEADVTVAVGNDA